MGAFDRLHPTFRAALVAASGGICRHGALAPEQGDDELLEAVEDGGCLQLVLRKGKILKAAHSGVEDPAEQAVFELFCQVLEGLPIQEAADHAGHHVVARLQEHGYKAPVAGIVTPWNADPLLHRPMRLIRQIRMDHAGRHSATSVENFWNPAISKDWLRLEEPAQLTRLDDVLSDFLAERSLQAGDMEVVGMEGKIRVLVAFAEGVAYQAKPDLLMAFERELRTATGNRLEVFAEEMKDTNRIRRL